MHMEISPDSEIFLILCIVDDEIFKVWDVLFIPCHVTDVLTVNLISAIFSSRCYFLTPPTPPCNMLQPSNLKWANIFLKSFIFSQFKHLTYFFCSIVMKICFYEFWKSLGYVCCVKFSHSNFFSHNSSFLDLWLSHIFVVTHIWRKNGIVFFTVLRYFVYKILDFF